MSAVAAPAPARAWWQDILSSLGGSAMDAVAYDTAWAARVFAPGGGDLALPAAWEWLCRHQHPDGAWGGDSPFLPDRALATAAALAALAEAARAGVRPPVPVAMAAGLGFLRSALEGLERQPPAVETVGFELCLPPLLEDLAALGVAAPPPPAWVAERRAAKLSRLPAEWRRRPPGSLVHSLEGWAGGSVPPGLLDAAHGCGNSPSATAFHQRLAPDPAGLAYLTRSASEGGVRDVYPFEVFELAWGLDHLFLAGVPPRHPTLCAAVTRLRAAWDERSGAGISASGLEPEADDSALAALTLARAGVPVSLQPLAAFERPDGFACFPFERDPSVSANIHVGYALSRLPYPDRRCALAKVLAFLADTRSPEGLWSDKWHLSPYYPTARAVVALHRVAPDLLAQPLDWLVSAQRPDGSWGAWGGSPEETAYAVEALVLAGRAEAAAMARAAAYLRQCADRPALWIGKGLYCPRAVVDAAVAAALHLAEGWTG